MSFLLSISYFDGLKKLQETNPLDEFEPLRQSARGEQTDLPRLKIAVSKSIDLLLSGMSQTDNEVTRTLAEARLLLMSDSSG